MILENVLELLSEQAEKDKAKAKHRKKDDLTGPFHFNDAPDQAGVPQEHASFVKRSCKHCYGRGFQTVLKSTTPKTTIVGDKFKRERHACGCVHKGYVRFRKEFDRAVAATMHTYPELSLEDARKMEIQLAGF